MLHYLIILSNVTVNCHADDQVPSPGRVALLLLVTILAYKYGGHKPLCLFHSKYVVFVLRGSPAATRIEHRHRISSYVRALINANFIYIVLGHNLRQ